MPYSQFKLAEIKRTFGLKVLEGVRFLPNLEPIAPRDRLIGELEDLPWAVAVGSEKARSESIIYPVLQEVRHILNRKISLFSGNTFDVDLERNLTGQVDFLFSRSNEQLTIEAPVVVVVVEAKKADLGEGLGQCLAEMVAAQQFNQAMPNQLSAVYGVITSGVQWQFLKLEGNTVKIDLTLYPLPPVEPILGFLVWMVEKG